MSHSPTHPELIDAVRRDLLRRVFGISAASIVMPGLMSGLLPNLAHAAAVGPAVPDQKPVKVSEHLYVLYARGPFPNKDNQGFFANVSFVNTNKGVVVIDSGTSLQIGEMALRMIKTITDKPVVAVFNTHFHGDHWLGNSAFKKHFPDAPIYAHPDCIKSIKLVTGQEWFAQMMKATDGMIEGTSIVPPDTAVQNGQEFHFGDVTLRVHHFGQAHTKVDIMLEIVQDKAVHVGDVAMDKRIANMEDGSFTGTLKVYDALEKAAPNSLWVPGHGQPDRKLLVKNRELLGGIYESAMQAVKSGKTIDEAKAMVLANPRVKKYAKDTQGFDESIGKFANIAFVEAEQNAF